MSISHDDNEYYKNISVLRIISSEELVSTQYKKRSYITLGYCLNDQIQMVICKMMLPKNLLRIKLPSNCSRVHLERH